MSIKLNQEQILEGTRTRLLELIAQPLVATTSQLHVVTDNLTVRHQEVVHVAFIHAPNGQRTVGFALCEADVAQ